MTFPLYSALVRHLACSVSCRALQYVKSMDILELSTAKGHQAEQGTKVFDIGREAERVATVQLGKEKPQEEVYECI